jgi:hypothetical protein
MMLKAIANILALLCFVTPGFSGEADHMFQNPFISISVGPSWSQPGATQTIALQPDVIDTYAHQTPINTLANGEVFFGIQRDLFQHVVGQFGLAFYISSPANLNGSIQVDGDPNFQNYTYQYRINHEHIALKSKWIFQQSLNINPYISGSVGVGFNRSYQYAVTPIIFQALPMPLFQSNTQTVVSYSLGGGFQRTFGQHITAAVGYQFVSWGASHLAPASGQTSAKGLGLSNVYSQGIEFNISYLL